MPEQYMREEWIGWLIAALEAAARREDRATLAKLRRGLGKPIGQAAERDIWLHGHLHGAAPKQEELAALIASLFALWHQGSRYSQRRPSRSLGGSFKELADAERRKCGKKLDELVPNVERRFCVLLDSHPEDLAERLRHAVSLLKSKEIPIDWAGLLDDLLRWNLEKRPVQRKWAREYWASRRENETSSVDGFPEVRSSAITN
jgi:CRISPR system Cascade subunit CasB